MSKIQSTHVQIPVPVVLWVIFVLFLQQMFSVIPLSNSISFSWVGQLVLRAVRLRWPPSFKAHYSVKRQLQRHKYRPYFGRCSVRAYRHYCVKRGDTQLISNRELVPFYKAGAIC